MRRSWSTAGPPRASPGRCATTRGRAFGKGLLVDEELARAVRLESAVAVCHWWGVGGVTVGKWRKVVGAGRKNNPGSQRLIRAAVLKASHSREVMQHRGRTAAREQARPPRASPVESLP